MIIEIVETFKKLSDGSILHPGDILDLPQEKAHRLIEKGRARLLLSEANRKTSRSESKRSGEAPSSATEEAPTDTAHFHIGDGVRFAHLRALYVREGVILESKWHPTLTRTYWYLIEIDFKKIWIPQSHVIGRIKTRRLLNKIGGCRLGASEDPLASVVEGNL